VARSEMPQIFLLAYFLFISQFTFVLHIDFNSDLVRETLISFEKYFDLSLVYIFGNMNFYAVCSEQSARFKYFLLIISIVV